MPFADVNGTRIHYQIEGDGEPLILIPGLGLDYTYYQLGVPAPSRSTRAESAGRARTKTASTPSRHGRTISLN
jgi:pimeloyl-ACP methyl ester carboxylesterase